MRHVAHSEPPLDSKWLHLLAERCSDLRGGGARFEDLYLEQRLEVRAVSEGSHVRVESCRLEGGRWMNYHRRREAPRPTCVGGSSSG